MLEMQRSVRNFSTPLPLLSKAVISINVYSIRKLFYNKILKQKGLFSYILYKLLESRKIISTLASCLLTL